jgi:hypothetical protein
MPLTIAYISEGIKKLRAVHAAQSHSGTTALWRGMKNLRVSEEFMSMRRGGTELAPMSTTSNLAVAAHYGVSGGSLVLKLNVDNFMQFGVSASCHRIQANPILMFAVLPEARLHAHHFVLRLIFSS